jgi:hypothetical protein
VWDASRKRPIRGIFADFLALVRDWWRVDRPRISPGEGRLLRVEAPAVLAIHTRRIEVISRRVDRQTGPPSVVYGCRCDNEACELRVTPMPGVCRLEVHWIDRQGDSLIAEDEVEVFAPRPGPSTG